MGTINLNVALKCESNASALLPAGKSSNGTQSPRLTRRVALTLAACTRQSTRSRCGRSPMVRCSSAMGRTRKPRSTWAVSGCWKLPTGTRRWRGRARPSSRASRRSRCAVSL